MEVNNNTIAEFHYKSDTMVGVFVPVQKWGYLLPEGTISLDQERPSRLKEPGVKIVKVTVPESLKYVILRMTALLEQLRLSDTRLEKTTEAIIAELRSERERPIEGPLKVYYLMQYARNSRQLILYYPDHQVYYNSKLKLLEPVTPSSIAAFQKRIGQGVGHSTYQKIQSLFEIAFARIPVKKELDDLQVCFSQMINSENNKIC